MCSKVIFLSRSTGLNNKSRNESLEKELKVVTFTPKQHMTQPFKTKTPTHRRGFTAPRVRLELTTLRLTAACSAIELPRNTIKTWA